MLVNTIFRKVSLASIEAFANGFEVIFPEDYAKFILKYNGGFPKPNKFYSIDQSQNSACEVLFGIDDGMTEYKHLTLNESWKDIIKLLYLPKEIFPIGQDGFGNQICICLKGIGYGNVVFYDHEGWNENDEERAKLTDLFLIANSFTEFLEKLY